MGSLLRHLLVLVALAAAPATPEVPPPSGFVTDRAGIIDPATREKLTALLQELQQKTGAEIAVLTVDTTAPLDDFSYAMQVAEAWKPGKRGEDTGVLMLVAVKDRKVRILVGYGLEGILPDGLVGQIQDREMLPEFRAGRMAEGIWRGAAALATRIAADRGVQLTGAPAPRAQRQAPHEARPIPLWALIVLVVIILLLMQSRGVSNLRGRRRGGFFPGGMGGGFGGGGFDGFGGGGGGFGGFGGGGFGGGGAGRSW